MKDLRRHLVYDNIIRFRNSNDTYKVQNCNLVDFDENLEYTDNEYGGKKGDWDIMLVETPDGKVLYDRDKQDNGYRVELL